MIWIVIALLMGAYWLVAHHFDTKKWRRWPTLAEYWEQHPQTRTEDGVKCQCCGSGNIRALGFSSGSDYRKLHQCQSCSTLLFRSDS